MSKGQKRSNREPKKPKAVKPKEPVAASFASSLTKGKTTPNGGGKKKTPLILTSSYGIGSSAG